MIGSVGTKHNNEGQEETLKKKIGLGGRVTGK